MRERAPGPRFNRFEAAIAAAPPAAWPAPNWPRAHAPAGRSDLARAEQERRLWAGASGGRAAGAGVLAGLVSTHLVTWRSNPRPLRAAARRAAFSALDAGTLVGDQPRAGERAPGAGP